MRSSGILMHISSLPSPYGIGTMGREARKYVDFLVQAGQTYWQVLPLGPTSFGDSPYQGFSGFAGNPYFIDLEILCKEKLLTKKECEDYDWGDDETAVDFGILYQNRYPLFEKAFKRFQKKLPTDYDEFCWGQGWWMEDYALFMALKDTHDGAAWGEWELELKMRVPDAIEEAKKELGEKIFFWKMLQYLFYKQWNDLKAYANSKGIYIIGDTPIYVAYDSADVWANPEQFYLDENKDPVRVAGCPPDAFTKTGQLWGNPLFRWDVMKADDYMWWRKRISHTATLYDVIRIDHFRGFDSYWAIPFGDKTAEKGEWLDGPGMDLFRVLKKHLGELDIIVEDLGFLTPSVLKMVKDSGFPGMKLLQFAFDSREDGDYLPHNFEKHSVVYTGTHDNDTIVGWKSSAPKKSIDFAMEYLNFTEEDDFLWEFMRACWATVGDMALVTMQDVLGLGSESRMNTPSTLGVNWKWRMVEDAADKELAKKIRYYMNLFGRVSKKEKDKK